MVMSIQMQEAVRKAVGQEPPLGREDVRGLDPRVFPGTFISYKESHNSCTVIGNLEMSKDNVVRVFQVQVP